MQRNLIHNQFGSGREGAAAPPTGLISAARDVNITSGNFLNVDYAATGILALSNHIAEDALHNAFEREPTPHCHPGTRKEALEVIRKWIKNNNTEKGLLWLSGKVGVGKSAVMQEITNELLGADPEHHPVAASFFFGRGKGRRALGRYLFPTIAYELAQNIRELREPINQIMQTDPALPTRSIRTQFQSLIINPLLQCQAQQLFITPRVIMIDGLDECEDTDNVIQRLIIDCITEAQHIHNRPLRFIIASRPEHQICNALEGHPLALGPYKVLLDNFESSQDIVNFLREKFRDIYQRKSNLMPHVSSSWPGDFVIFQLVKNAEGQWIYVTTIIKYTDAKFTSPDEQLEIVMDYECQSLALSPLDILYTQILSCHPKPEILLEVLSYIAFMGYHHFEADAMSVRLGLGSGDIKIALQVIQSLLADDSLRFAHASFGDYLLDPERSGDYFLDWNNVYQTKYSVQAFVVMSSIIVENFQQSQQYHQIITNETTYNYEDNLGYRPGCILSNIQADTLSAVALDFESTIESVDLSSIPLDLCDLTHKLLSPLYSVYNFLQYCNLEFSDIASPYRSLLHRCLNILAKLPDSLYELVHFAPVIISISRGIYPKSITSLSHLSNVERDRLEVLLKRNYIFFEINEEGDDDNLDSFGDMERSVCHYSASVVLGKCCLSSNRLDSLDQICSTALQPLGQSKYFNKLSQIQYHKQEDDIWGLTFVLVGINPCDERVQECSAWPSHSFHFYERLKEYTQDFLPNLVNATVPVIRCMLNALAFIVRILDLAKDIHPQESRALETIQDQIFCQIFQLTSYQNRNMIIFRQPFLAYHALTVEFNDPYDVVHSSGHFTTLSTPPLPVDHNHPPQISLYLLATDTYYAEWFITHFLHYASNPSRSGTMFIGPLDDILQQIKQMKVSTYSSDPHLQAIVKKNCDTVLRVLEVDLLTSKGKD